MIDVVARLNAIAAWNRGGHSHANVGDKGSVLDYLWVSAMILKRDAKCHLFRTRCGTMTLSSGRIGEDARRCEELDEYMRGVGHVSEHLSRTELAHRVQQIPVAFRSDTDNLVGAMQALSKLYHTSGESASRAAEDHIRAIFAYNQHLGCLALISKSKLRACIGDLTAHDRSVLFEAIRHTAPSGTSITKASGLAWWIKDTFLSDVQNRIEEVNTRLRTDRAGRLLLSHLPSSCAFSPILIDAVARQYPEGAEIPGDSVGKRDASASVMSALACALIAGETMVSAWQRLSSEAGGDFSLLS